MNGFAIIRRVCSRCKRYCPTTSGKTKNNKFLCGQCFQKLKTEKRP